MVRKRSEWSCRLYGAAVLATLAATAAAEEPATGAAATFAVHGQITIVDQANAAFTSPYVGPNSLDPRAQGRETADVTLYLGTRPWRGAEFWINGEVDQGFGLSDTLGLAGFPSGEAYKVGASLPYLKLPRLFLRQTIDLGGPRRAVEADINQFAGEAAADRIVITLGKFSVPDIFDTNRYAHDPRHDFLNWSVIDSGTFDYAADAWGFTYGGAAEWYVDRWAARIGAFNLSVVPNSEKLESNFSQFQIITELEERHTLASHPGKVEVTGFLSRGRMGEFGDAIALAEETGQPADIASVRRYRSRGGVSFNLEQDLGGEVGLFARGGIADGNVEPYEFSDIDRTLTGGLSIGGRLWRRLSDTVGVAAGVNTITAIHQRFLDAGGLGILVGDGKLPHPGAEAFLETYYDWAAFGPAHLTLDYQFFNHPAYNRDRGPVSVLAVRLHAQF